jgi:hypothetical protein
MQIAFVIEFLRLGTAKLEQQECVVLAFFQALARIMHTLDLQGFLDERNMMRPRDFRTSGTAE